MPEQNGDKTLDATPHRRQQAREKGQVAFSQDLGSATLLLVGTLTLMLLGKGVVHLNLGIMQRHLREVPLLEGDPAGVLVQAKTILSELGMVMLPILGLLFIAGVATNVFQVGLLWVPSKLRPDLRRINPLQGLQRIFSLSGTMRLGFGLFKVMVIGIVYPRGAQHRKRRPGCSARPRASPRCPWRCVRLHWRCGRRPSRPGVPAAPKR